MHVVVVINVEQGIVTVVKKVVSWSSETEFEVLNMVEEPKEKLPEFVVDNALEVSGTEVTEALDDNFEELDNVS